MPAPDIANLSGLVDEEADACRHGADPRHAEPCQRILGGKKGLSIAMVQRLRARFRVPADLLLPPPKTKPAWRAARRAAA